MPYVMNKEAIKEWWSEYCEITFTTSKSYKVVTFFGYLISFIMSIDTYQVLVSFENGYNAIIFRTIIDSLWLFFITHFFIRSFIKIRLLQIELNTLKIITFLLFLLVVTGISSAGVYGIEKIGIFELADVNNLKIDVSKVEISKVRISMMLIISTYMSFIGWAIVYLFWHQQINRKKMQKEMHQAQIQQLTNQLNPHFLFNAFNSIRALIYEDKDKAADTVTQLSELFRTHLQAHLKAQSTLEDEWQVSSRYLAIESIRLEERLQLKVDIDDELLKQHLPTLTLLTLVENAIKHGISPNSEAGIINVRAIKINDKCWQLSVGNSVNKESKADGTNTGMKNVKQRMELMFGRKYHWQQSKTDNYFEVKMECPIA
jgi:two-component system sensor histidine kinase AlgZ